MKAGVSIEELAEDIVRRSLPQTLNVRPVLDADGQETGMFEVPAGGRRYRALELLVKQERMNKTQPVPCVVRTEGLAEEDSLAENVQRAALHPLDQFCAFQTLRDKGLSEETIARVSSSAQPSSSRLKLAAVSQKLLDVYAEDGMTLEQLMAFTVTNNHARQEQVWEALAHNYNKEPYHRQLTEGAVRAADKQAQFVGVDVYEACVTCSSMTMAAGSGPARLDDQSSPCTPMECPSRKVKHEDDGLKPLSERLITELTKRCARRRARRLPSSSII